MTLSFIDPKDEFERFFTDNPAKLIQGFLIHKQKNQKQLYHR